MLFCSPNHLQNSKSCLKLLVHVCLFIYIYIWVTNHQFLTKSSGWLVIVLASCPRIPGSFPCKAHIFFTQIYIWKVLSKKWHQHEHKYIFQKCSLKYETNLFTIVDFKICKQRCDTLLNPLADTKTTSTLCTS
jgi:hypothetical protein